MEVPEPRSALALKNLVRYLRFTNQPLDNGYYVIEISSEAFDKILKDPDITNPEKDLTEVVNELAVYGTRVIKRHDR